MTTQEKLVQNAQTEDAAPMYTDAELDGAATETKGQTNWRRDLNSRAGIVGELFGFLWKVRLWWMIPMMVVLLLFFFIFIFGASTPLAPFIYSLR
ncbi:MAG: DUF5989 family protein [Aggregatilineales bacterium]